MDIKSGDVFSCGKHYVACGDCRDDKVLEKLFDIAGIDNVNGVFTSPPYAMQKRKFYGGVPVEKYIEWWDAVQGNVAKCISEDGSFFVNIKEHCKDGQRVLYCKKLVIDMVERCGWRFVDEFMWLHQGFPGRYKCRFKSQFEPVYHFCKGWPVKFFPKSVSYHSDSVPYRMFGDIGRERENGVIFCNSRKKSGLALPGNVLKISQGTSGANHAAAFPVSLPEFFIKAFSDTGDIWLDPFVGSGSTIIASTKTNRIGLGIEILPKYVSICLERLRGVGLEILKVC